MEARPSEEAAPDFTECTTYEELMAVLYSIEGVQGSQQFYTRKEIQEQIQEYTSALATGNVDFAEQVLSEITSVGGLRQAVEIVTKKRIEKSKK